MGSKLSFFRKAQIIYVFQVKIERNLRCDMELIFQTSLYCNILSYADIATNA